MSTIHGGRLIARALRAEGVDTVYTLTGGHIVAILDGCVQEGIRLVDMRHEQAAALAAEAHARLTGTLGVAVVTAGPGVTNAITGVANAHWSHTPLLLIGGRHMVRQEQRGGLQEMDHPRLFEPITRWRATAWESARLGEYIGIAARHAQAGRGGPVFLDVPMDRQFDAVGDSDRPLTDRRRARARHGASPDALDEVVEALAGAHRPVVFAGGGFHGDVGGFTEMVRSLGAPTYLNGRARGALRWDDPLLGVRSRSTALSAADVVLALGVDWDFRTRYGEGVNADAIVIQVDAEPTKIGWNRPAQIGIVADPATVVGQLTERASEFKGAGTFAVEMMTAEQAAREEALARSESDEVPIAPERFAREVAEFFGEDGIVSVDGGDIVSTTVKWMRTSRPGWLLDPGPLGTLGTGAPYAIAAKVVHPDRLVGTVYGDGGFGFNAMEYDTMVRLGIPVVGVVGNDGQWSNIKTYHQAFFPDRVVAADLGLRRYDLMVAGLGGYGEYVTEPSEIRPALERGRDSGLPALVNVTIARTARMSSNYSQ